MPELLFCLMGATASGKTALACELIKHFPMEIISVDSTMIYRGMDIGTAKPSPEELLQAPHHLIDILDPIDSYSAADFCEDVKRLTQAIRKRGNIPLLVGGTMMYFHVLQQGLALIPQADATIRAALLQQAEQQGWDYLHQQLAEVDAVSAAKIHPHDTQRIQRALEVYQLTGKPLSAFWADKRFGANDHFVNLILMPQERGWLHERIATRFAQMLQAGFVAEVEGLLKRWPLSLANPAMRAVGYRQVYEYLSGTDDIHDLVQLHERGIAATRQLAKRQLTWLRHWPQARTFVCENPGVLHEIIIVIQSLLQTKLRP